MFFTIQQKKIEEEIVEKKSKFIATLCYAKDEKEAQNIVKELKKQYFDARHNCFAYRVISENGVVERFSDDGEPSGTAGMPMLNILSKNNLCNVVVVVTRYFGGILLGTGGLVRAYSDVTLKAIENATLTNETLGLEVEVEVTYTQLELLKYYCKRNNINIINIEYENNVKCFLELTDEEYNKIMDNTNVNFDIIQLKVICKRNIRKILEEL